MEKLKKCVKCEERITGFIAHSDGDGDWCENCLASHTCDGCGEIQDSPIQDEQSDGLCSYCE